MASGNPWMPEEDALLERLIRQGLSWPEIGARLRRPFRACANRWYRIRRGEGSGRHLRPWTQEEDDAIRERYAGGDVRLEDLAEAWGRSLSAVKGRAKTLGLAASRVPKSLQEACAGLRRCHDCGRPTPDFRCPACRRKWQIKHGVPLDVAARNSSGDE